MLAIIVLIFFALFAYPAQSQVPPGNCGTVSSCNQASTPLTGAEQIFVNQGGTTKRALLSQIPGTCNSGSNCPAYFSAIGTLINPAAGTLRANTAAVLLANVAGYYGPGTAGGGTFVKTTGSCGDNGGTVIKDSAGQCWDRQYAPNISAGVQDFGAKCDGTTDDSAAIQAALNASYSTSFPPSASCLAHGLTVSGTTHAILIQGQTGDQFGGGSCLVYNGSANGTLLQVSAGGTQMQFRLSGMCIRNGAGVAATGIELYNGDAGLFQIDHDAFSGFDIGASDSELLITGNAPGTTTNSVWITDNTFGTYSSAILFTAPAVNEIHVERNTFLGQNAIYDDESGTSGPESFGIHIVISDCTFYAQSVSAPFIVGLGGMLSWNIENNYFESTGGISPLRFTSSANATPFAGLNVLGNTFNLGLISSTTGLVDLHGSFQGVTILDNASYSTGQGAMANFNAGTVRQYIVSLPALSGAMLTSTIADPSCTTLICSDSVNVGTYTTPSCSLGLKVGATTQTLSASTCEAATNGLVTTVTFNMSVNGSVSGTGAVELTGLPTVGSGNGAGGASPVYIANGLSLGGSILAVPTIGGTVAPLYTQGVTAPSAITNSNLGTNAQIAGTLVYANQ